MDSFAILAMNPAVDLFVSVRHLVTGRKLRCTPGGTEAGGGGINVARAARRLGGAPVVLYTRGGGTGKKVEEMLCGEGIDSIPLPIQGETRENISVLEEATGDHLRLVMPGPELEENEWRQALQTLEDLSPFPRFLVASGSLPPGVPVDFYLQVGRIAADRGSRFILDKPGDAAVAEGGGVYLLKPNLRELSRLSGRAVNDRSAQEEAALSLVRRGLAQVVVVSLGAAGVLYASADGPARLNAPQVSTRSKIGAGDSMVAGIVLGLAGGKSLRESVLYGVAAGASAVMAPGMELSNPDVTDKLYRALLAEAGNS